MTIGRSALAMLAVLVGCQPDRAPPPPAAPPARTSPTPPRPSSSSSSSSSSSPGGSAGDADCARDEDCVLLPEITCCEECVPAPPFEPAPTWRLDERLLETEERCLRDDRPCSAFPRCPALPRGCEARPICDHGRCGVVAVGCTRPVS